MYQNIQKPQAKAKVKVKQNEGRTYITMIFQVNKSVLHSAVSKVARAAASRATVQAMEGILFETVGNTVKLTAYDGKIGIYTSIGAEVKEHGAIVIQAKFMLDLVRKLPNADVVINADDNLAVNIKCGKVKIDVMGYPPSDFPELDVVGEARTINVPETKLKSMIEQTIFAVSTSETRPLYTGILFETAKDNLTLVALDGYRMAVRNEAVNCSEEPIEFIVPGTTLNEIKTICSPDSPEPVKISIGDKHTSFEIENTTIISRRLEGNFMNYNKSIPQTFSTKIVIHREELISSIERMSMIIKDNASSPIKMTVNDGFVDFYCATSFGVANDSCECAGNGNNMVIGFNDRYLLDALKAVNEKTVTIKLNSPQAPIIIQSEDNSKYLYMVLPVRLKDGA